MNKSIEEEWELDGVSYIAHQDGSFVAQCAGEDEAKLAAAAPKMARMLLVMESVLGYDGQCMSCSQYIGITCKDGKHLDNCAWLQLMKEIGARE